MALISLPNDKKISHKRKSPQRALWTISREAFTLPFSFTCLAERKEEEMQELCKVFHFFFDGLPLPKTNFFNWFVSHLPMMAWQADSLPGSLSIFFSLSPFLNRQKSLYSTGLSNFSWEVETLECSNSPTRTLLSTLFLRLALSQGK